MKTEEYIHIHQQSLFYRLLMDPGKIYRICRHALLILGVAALSFNQVYMGFFEYGELLGYNLYLFTFLIMITYLCEGYFNMYVLVPRYFLKEKYRSYFVSFFLTIFLFVILHYSLEYLFFRLHNVEPGIFSYFKSYGSPFWLEFMAGYFGDCIAILGAGMVVILKCWLMNDKQKSRLEKKHMQTEVEKLKEQVNPEFLFTVLRKMGDITIVDQQKASDMLLELSALLRYQLYDSNREKVLIAAEISFITNYLRIEKLYYEKMDFEINTMGEVHCILTPPLLFIPLVHYAVKDFQKREESFFMNIQFRSTIDFVSFSCDCYSAELIKSKDLDKIKLRLERLYKKRYLLDIAYNQEGQPVLYLQINL